MAKRGGKSITSRWFVNSFGVVAALLIIVNFFVFFALKSYYYGAAEQYLGTEANIISGVLLRYYDGSGTKYSAEIRSAIEEFDRKSTMELMAIDSKGKVQLTSSGFSPDGGAYASYTADMPDYNDAMVSADGTGHYTGYLDSSEKYMAISVRLDAAGGAYSAIRVVSSLDKIDMQIYTTLLLTVLLSAGVLLLLLFLGLYFIRSIVNPIRQIGASARKLARGDFSVRLQAKNDDEVGELCGIFNYLAGELQNSDQIKNDFISSVSHELRTPLTAIRGWSETILEMRDEETITKGMKVITEETERLSGMVEELLDFSRIQNGKLSLQKANMDVLAELADALLVYAERAKHDGITINYNEPDAVAIIYGDKNRLRQVFINIIDNAIKYGGKGCVINVEAVLEDGKIVISIADSGIGISEADLPKIKTKFYKANNTVRGSGIGLAVADEIITMHGGTLDIKSVLGSGTTVIITLSTLPAGGNKQ